jgi:hypothetical protein
LILIFDAQTTAHPFDEAAKLEALFRKPRRAAETVDFHPHHHGKLLSISSCGGMSSSARIACPGNR